METHKAIVAMPDERIASKIFFIRAKKVMLDRDLAELYGVETGILNRAVKRNKERFPDDFMFQLNTQEMSVWESQLLRFQNGISSVRSQNGISRRRWGGRRYAPYVFTEQGVAMLSSVLNSERAIQVNIQIIRTFTKLREMIATHKDLRQKIEAMEKKYDRNFKIVFDAIARLLKKEARPKRHLGFHT